MTKVVSEDVEEPSVATDDVVIDVRVPDDLLPAKDALRVRVLEELASVAGHIALSERLTGSDAKEELRRAHQGQRAAILESSRDFIETVEDWAVEQFADGTEIDPRNIEPFLIPVSTKKEADLFRFASLQWSVPVSQGYGRRTRFLIMDRQNGKLIGIFALGDPVIAQQARDLAVGWNKDQRMARLYNVLDAFVLGAVDPYRQLLAGKLSALATISNEARSHIVAKYAGNVSEISAQQKDPTPALITTSSALGKSSVYNRVTFNGHTMFHSVGYTKGYGHFQFSESLFSDLKDFIREVARRDTESSNLEQSSRYGSGPNWRFRVLRTGLNLLSIPPEALQHRIRREVFVAPVAENWDSFLRGEEQSLRLFDLPLADIGSYFCERWASGRAERMPGYRLWQRDDARLSRQLVGPRQLSMLMEGSSVGGKVEFRPYVARTYCRVEEIRGETVSGAVCDGQVDISQIVGPQLDMEVGDIRWDNGEREIRGMRLLNGDPHLQEIIGRLRIGVYQHPELDESLVMDLRLPVPHESTGRVTARQMSMAKLYEVVGREFVDGLDLLCDVTFGSRSELLRDKGRRRNELCAVFPASRSIAPLMLWIMARMLPVQLAAGGDKADRPVELVRTPGATNGKQ